MGYRKFFYWINSENIETSLDEIRIQLNLDSIPQAKLRQCESLHANNSIMHVLPETWSRNCVRQGSWFRSSPKRNDHLIVANQSLPFLQSSMMGEITLEKFFESPTNCINSQKIHELINSSIFKQQAPIEWFHLLDREIPIFTEFLRKNNQTLTLDEFLTYHSANHAYFLQSTNQMDHFIVFEGKNIPCSLFETVFTCSACMELFGIIGAHHGSMALKKCPGLKYVDMQSNEFLITKIIIKSAKNL